MLILINPCLQLEGRITRVIGDIQQAETKQIQLRYIHIQVHVHFVPPTEPPCKFVIHLYMYM